MLSPVRRCCYAALLLAGCTFDPSAFAPSSGADASGPPADAGRRADAAVGTPDAVPGTPDAMPGTPDAAPTTPDAAPGTPDAAGCPGDILPFEPVNFERCDVPPIGAALTVPAGSVWSIDTDTGDIDVIAGLAVPPALSTRAVTQTGAPAILIVAVDELHVQGGGVLGASGSRALAIVSASNITVDGLLYAGGFEDSTGPGADHAVACADGIGADGTAQTTSMMKTGGSGGGGGGYGQDGGTGAKVHDSGGADSDKGRKSGNKSLVPLRGGCSGGDGGHTGGGRAGGGGGAVQLVAAEDVVVNTGGAVTASGGGGRAPTASNSGGGGGGSGGAVLVEADAITVLGAITANGGAGGEGSRTGSSADAGENGHSSDATPAAGGSSFSSGGDGGDGGTRSAGAEPGQEGESSAPQAAGGGGGGGGVGRIRLTAHGSTPLVSGTVSPVNE